MNSINLVKTNISKSLQGKHVFLHQTSKQAKCKKHSQILACTCSKSLQHRTKQDRANQKKRKLSTKKSQKNMCNHKGGTHVQRCCSQTNCSKIHLLTVLLIQTFIYTICIYIFPLMHPILGKKCINTNISMLILQMRVKIHKTFNKPIYMRMVCKHLWTHIRLTRNPHLPGDDGVHSGPPISYHEQELGIGEQFTQIRG